MSLRLQINLIIGVLLATFASLLIAFQLQDTRQSVDDEMEGANMVATQLLSRLQAANQQTSLIEMKDFLNKVGRVRAKEIELIAIATAEGLRKIAAAIQEPGGQQAVSLRVAEQYIKEFGNLAKTNNPMIVPADLANVGAAVAGLTEMLNVVRPKG